MKPDAPAPDRQLDLLIVEQQFVLRRTLVAVAHELHIARMQEATSVEAAAQRLALSPFDGVVVDLCDGMFELLSRLRGGGFASAADIPIIAMTSGPADDARDARLLSLGHALLLRKPFKVAELLQIVQRMTPAGVALAA